MALPVTRGTACGGVVMAPAGKTPKMKGGRGKLKGYTGFSLTVGNCQRECQQGRHAGRTPWQRACTGLVKETIPTGTEKVDVRAPRESGREDNAQIPVLLNQGQGNAPEVNTAVRAAAQRTEDHKGRFGGANTQGEAPPNTPGLHGIEGHLKVSLGSGENDEVISMELASVTEGVRGSEGNTGDGRAKSDSETVNQQIEKKGRKNSALRNARVDPRF